MDHSGIRALSWAVQMYLLSELSIQSFVQMEFTINPKSLDSVPEEFRKGKWTIEDCKEYIRKRREGKDNQMIPLHQIMQGAKLDVTEPKHVQVIV